MTRSAILAISAIFIFLVSFAVHPSPQPEITQPEFNQRVSVDPDLDLSPVAFIEGKPSDSDVQPNESKPLAKVGKPFFASPHSNPIAFHNGQVFVANTPADTLDVFDSQSNKLIQRISVGVDPVSVAVRPDGKEIWVSNHVSDSVSVIDNDRTNSTYFQIIATIQDFDEKSKATQFDEPVGIAFADNTKAYVALSSENQIAVVDVKSRRVRRRISIPAQDPRSIVVRKNRLYVIPFESNNQTQLSGGTGKIDGDLVTFNAWEHSIANNNVLSLGHVVDIVKHPKVPDRDLFVYDTATDKLIQSVDTLGTLLYGMDVDSSGNVYIAQTDARNDINGRSGTKKHSLVELDNRAFLNRVTKVSLQAKGKSSKQFFDLEPLPPTQPTPADAIATPFAIKVTGDDKTLVMTAAGSDKLVTLDAKSGQVLGQTAVEAVPRGIALQNDKTGKPRAAWILNSVANTISVVDLTNIKQPKQTATIQLEDPTEPEIKRGRIAFNTAAASSTGTFSCASCHPDGHTDQLLWVLKTPVVTGGDQIMPRSTMPIRGLRDTAPFHWDGIPGDPYGGNNSGNIYGHDQPNVDDTYESAPRHLIDGGLASTMLLDGDEAKNNEGKAGYLSDKERDDMAKFLLSVTYPPAQKRAYNDQLSARAKEGFELFHIKGDLDGKPRPNVCGDCHRMPFLVSTNTPGTGMDAPTWRGANDRWLILPQGRLNIIDFDFFERISHQGIPERQLWQFSWGGRRRFDPVWDMVLEASTGYSGAFARQVTISKETLKDDLTEDLMTAMEQAAEDGGIVLELNGTWIDQKKSKPETLQFDPTDSIYRLASIGNSKSGQPKNLSKEELRTMVDAGKFIGTLTARHGESIGYARPQPAIWTEGPIHQQRGRQRFPIIFDKKLEMQLSGRHIFENPNIFVDGQRVSGVAITDPESKQEELKVQLDKLPKSGIHFLQFQNPGGLFSNEFIFFAAANEADANKLRRSFNPGQTRIEFLRAVAEGKLKRVQSFLTTGIRLNARHPDNGMTALSTAVFHGRMEVAKLLIKKGAKTTSTNRDGNTPLHLAAFLGRESMIDLLLENGADVEQKNDRGETPVDSVSGEWNDGLAGFYRGIIGGANLELDVETIRKQRPQIAKRLRDGK